MVKRLKYTSYAQNIHELSRLKELKIDEVILSDKTFSRFSENFDFSILAIAAKELGFRVIFEWDVLIVEQDFSLICREFNKIDPNLYDAIRVQDPGVLEFILDTTDKKIQFIAETGNHNITGLKKWESYIGERLERLILSIELNKDTLKEYISKLYTPVEILLLGRILLFYSPRYLLNSLVKDISEDYIKAYADSEESPHKGFPLVQNRHGTFMFHLKNLFLLDRIEEIFDIGLTVGRLDLRDLAGDKSSATFIENFMMILHKNEAGNEVFSNLKALYPKEVIRGYFQINKSDVLFNKLKNYRIQRRDNDYLGEIIESSKPHYMALELKGKLELHLEDEISFFNPEGKLYKCKVYLLKDFSNQDIKLAKPGDLVLINYMGGVWPKSQVYKVNE